MHSKIYIGEVSHTRLQPVRHAFRYPLYFFGFDLAELRRLPIRPSLFGYNRLRPVALFDRDYLEAGDAPLREKLDRLLDRFACADGIAAVELVTSARTFNYVFNPVSFFLCRRADGALRCVVAEVRNTFGEKHLYVLDTPGPASPGTGFRHAKEFHVSPFHDMDGGYDFSFDLEPDSLQIRVNMIRNGQEVFLSCLSGRAVPLDTRHLVRTLLRYPLTAFLTMPRILAQAARLRFGKKLRVYAKPEPRSPMTRHIRRPSRYEQWCLNQVLRRLGTMGAGWLTLELPDGREVKPAGASRLIPQRIRVSSYRFFSELVSQGDTGLGDAYMRGDWTTDDLTGVLSNFALTALRPDSEFSAAGRAGRLLNRIRHLLRGNTRRGSRRNIRAHYDLSNELFRLFLDESLTYSCALYRDGGESLEQAQRNKIRVLLEKTGVGPGDHLLEIGSGWGALAMEAARTTGCRVTTITLSREQKRLAEERVRAAGLANRIVVLLADYRDVQGACDAIISVEMLEAVGHEHFGEFFAACDRLLKPGGRLVLQVITIPDQRYEVYRRGCDWIQKRIFPGGHLPSLGALREALSDRTDFQIQRLDNIGIHYARTLREWRERFHARRAEVRALGFDDEFIRMWTYYLCYCEAGFATRQLNNLQLVLDRAEIPLDPAGRMTSGARILESLGSRMLQAADGAEGLAPKVQEELEAK